MKTTPKALKGLYTALGGSSPIADESKTVDVLNAISEKIGGDGGATKIPDAIDNIAAKADDLVIPTGKLSITGTAEVDCSAYAKAQVSSATLLAENIKKDVSILGVTGSYEGGGGSSDFSTAEVTIINQATMSLSNVPATVCYEENDLGDGVPATLFPSIISIPSSQTGSIKCALYKGTSAIMFADYTEFVEISVSGDATYMGGMVAVTGDCTITITEKQ